MNKPELLTKINNIPLFRLRDVAVKEFPDDKKDIIYEEMDTNFDWIEKPSAKAVTEMDNTEPLAFVCNRYSLVQFKEMFEPIVNKIENLTGDLVYYKGFAIMDIFPEEEDYKFVNNQVGIVAYNSVNKTYMLLCKIWQ